MKFENYIKEQQDVNKIKKEIIQLRSWKAKKRLKPEGQKKLERLEDKLFKMGIFDF